MNNTVYYGMAINEQNLPPLLRQDIELSGIKDGVCVLHGKAHVFPEGWLTKKPYCTACRWELLQRNRLKANGQL